MVRPQGIGGGGDFSGESASSRAECVYVCVRGGGGGEMVLDEETQSEIKIIKIPEV